MLRHSHLLLIEHPAKVFIARVLIEPSPAAGQNISGGGEINYPSGRWCYGIMGFANDTVSNDIHYHRLSLEDDACIVFSPYNSLVKLVFSSTQRWGCCVVVGSSFQVNNVIDLT
eukprot:scaffold9846_cov224-Skeletonema_marinoi.AAC.1